MYLKNRIATAALTGLSLALTLALTPMTFVRAAQTPTPAAQPAAAAAPASIGQSAETLAPAANPAATPAPATFGQSAQTLAPAANPAAAPASAAFAQSAQTIASMAHPAAAAASVTLAQTAQTPTPTAAAAPKAASSSPDYVEEKGFKGKIFELKYRDPFVLNQVIRPLGSGFKGTTTSVDREFRTITVRDFPENIAAMEEAIKRLDTPEAPRPDIEFSVNVLIASNSVGGSEDYPPELGDVVKQLKSALKYKSYTLMTSGIHRAKEARGGVANSGVAESSLFSSVPTPPNPIFYEYSLELISIDAAAATVQVGEFRFNMRVPLNMGTSVQYQNVGFKSPVGLRPGEKVVVGSTTMGDKGLVVVVSAKLLK